MDDKQTCVASSSRFHFRLVSTSQRNRETVAVDLGCQRCQHCTMVRRAAIAGFLISDANVLGGKRGKGVHPCL